MTFEESNLFFNFSAAWEVYPFDDHYYYLGLSGRGFRCVDFIGVYQSQLVLMEVKNYRRRAGMPDADALQAVRSDPFSFADKIRKKVTDSLYIIHLIDRYYQRRWWSRGLKNLPPKIRRRIHPRRDFWYRAIELAQDPRSCIFVLWLEADGGADFAGKAIIPFLRRELAENVREVWLAGGGANPFGEHLRVGIPNGR